MDKCHIPLVAPIDIRLVQLIMSLGAQDPHPHSPVIRLFLLKGVIARSHCRLPVLRSVQNVQTRVAPLSKREGVLGEGYTVDNIINSLRKKHHQTAHACF